jgi:hypothetical protein
MVEFSDKSFHLTGFADGSTQGLPIDRIHDSIGPLHLPLDMFLDTTCAIGAEGVSNLSGDGYGVDETMGLG